MHASIPKHILKSKLKVAHAEDFQPEIEEFKKKYAVEPLQF
jgi:hypothetical protein